MNRISYMTFFFKMAELNVTQEDKQKRKICLFSYNTRGFSDEKQDVCKNLMIESKGYFPILCNQENFLLRANSYKVDKCLPDAKIYFKPAVKNSLNGGRAKNGMFIAIPKELKGSAKDVSPNHWRVQAITHHKSKQDFDC